MRDKHFLINSWPFFEKHIKNLARYLQDKAAEVYTSEENETTQRALRLTQEQVELNARSLVQLTGSSVVFAQIHLWFAWLLSVGSTRLEEQLPTRELECNVEEKEEFKGFVMVEDLQHKRLELTEDVVKELRKLRTALGFFKFQCLLYSTLVGHQVVIRGCKEIVLHVIKLLKYFLPKKKFRCVDYADCYKAPDICNIIGLNLFAAVPKPTLTISRLDILRNAEDDNLSNVYSDTDYNNYALHLRTGFDAPPKWPTLLAKADATLADTTLNEKFVVLYINSLMEEWMNLTGVITKAKTKTRATELTGLLHNLNVLDQDRKLLQFWSS